MAELSALVDEYLQARSDRLILARTLAELERQEKAKKKELIDYLRANELTAAGGTLGITKLQPKDKPIVNDWEEVYKYIKANDAFDLLQRRLTETAVKLRWDDGIRLPGIETLRVYDVSISGVSK